MTQNLNEHRSFQRPRDAPTIHVGASLQGERASGQVFISQQSVLSNEMDILDGMWLNHSHHHAGQVLGDVVPV